MPIEPGTVHAPDFPAGLEWLNTSQPLSIQQLRGKIVLLDFWTYCCINCMHVLPDLHKLEHKYGNELVVIGVHSAKFDAERQTENIRQAVLRYEIEHPVVNDHQMRVWQEYAVRAWPTLILIDPHGKVIGSHSGEGVFELFDPVIGQLIERFDAEGALDRGPVQFALERQQQPESLLSFPGKVLADAAGDRLFIADSNHNRIVVASLAGDLLEIIGAGSMGLSDGRFEQAELHHPQGMALDGDRLYIADTGNHAIRCADLKSWQLVTLAGTGAQSRERDAAPSPARGRALNSPWDVTLAHGVLFIAMAGPHQIWGLDLAGGVIAGHAGSGREGHQDGLLLAAALAQPSGLATDGQVLFIADSEVSSIRTADLDPRGGQVRTIVGQGLFDYGDVDGAGDDVRLQHPLDVEYLDETLFVADTYNHKIKSVGIESRACVTFAGSGLPGLIDGDPEQARFDEPSGLSAAKGKLYIADTNNHCVRVIDLKTQQVSTFQLRQPAKLVTAGNKPRRLPAQAVLPGDAVLKVTLALPDGYRLNRTGPSEVWIVQNGRPRAVQASQFPMQIPFQMPLGGETLRGGAIIFYCQEGREPLCLYHREEWELPLSEGPQAGSEVDLTLRIR